MVDIVQQMNVGPNGFAHCLKQAGRVVQIFLGAPIVLTRQGAIRRFIHAAVATHPIDFVETRNAALRTNGQVAHFFVTQHFVYRFCGVAACGVRIRHDGGTASTA